MATLTPHTDNFRLSEVNSVRVMLLRDHHSHNRAEELFVKYAFMGISFILLLWVGTFYLML